MNTSDDMSEYDDDLRIAEYVLGVLDAPQRRAVEALIASDSQYAVRLAVWQERFAPLAEDIVPVTPPHSLWARVLAAVPQPGLVSPVLGKPTPDGWRLWDSVVVWRWLTASGLAAVLVLSSVLLLHQLPGEQAAQPALTAALQLESGQAAFTATIDPQRRRIIVIPAAPIDLDGRAAELWLIAPGGSPQSLGLLATDRAMTVAVPAELRRYAEPKTIFAISLEPAGGSPTGQPTGPVIAKGEVFSI